MSSYHLSPNFIPYYLDALEKYRVKYLWGYSSSLYALAQEALRRDIRLPMVVAITNAEPLFDNQREVISDAFSCPAHQTYGMSEMVTAASECDHGQLHCWPEVGLNEIEGHEGEILDAVSGNFVCTGITERWLAR
jgi:phenylacetate-CoA ligase